MNQFRLATTDETATMILLALAGVSLGLTLGVYLMGATREDPMNDSHLRRTKHGYPYLAFEGPQDPSAWVPVGVAVALKAGILRLASCTTERERAGVLRLMGFEIAEANDPRHNPLPEPPKEHKDAD